MSTDMMTYLNYLASLETASDEQLNGIVNERAQFILVGKSDNSKYDSSVDGVFNNLQSLAQKLEEEKIADDSVKLAEDAAAVAAIWSFGLSMAAFVSLAVTDAVLQKEIKAAENDLNTALSTADKDIAAAIGDPMNAYITIYKANNNFIAAQAPTGLTAQTARSYLYNFMDYISTHGGVGLANFRKYIESARLTLNDPNINKIYNLLDEFNLGDDKGKDAMKKVLDGMNSAGLAGASVVRFVMNFTFAIWLVKMKVSANDIQAAAEAAEVPAGEAEASVFEGMDAIGKVAGAVTIVLSVVDAVFNVYDIVETVERYNKMSATLKDARKQYKDFFDGIYTAAAKYTPPPKKAAPTDDADDAKDAAQ